METARTKRLEPTQNNEDFEFVFYSLFWVVFIISLNLEWNEFLTFEEDSQITNGNNCKAHMNWIWFDCLLITNVYFAIDPIGIARKSEWVGFLNEGYHPFDKVVRCHRKINGNERKEAKTSMTHECKKKRIRKQNRQRKLYEVRIKKKWTT